MRYVGFYFRYLFCNFKFKIVHVIELVVDFKLRLYKMLIFFNGLKGLPLLVIDYFIYQIDVDFVLVFDFIEQFLASMMIFFVRIHAQRCGGRVV